MLAFAFIAALLIMLIKAFRNWTRQTSAILQALKIGEAAREMRKETPCSVCGPSFTQRLIRKRSASGAKRTASLRPDIRITKRSKTRSELPPT